MKDVLTEMAHRPIHVDDVEGGRCPSCGAEVEDGAEFCTECGSRVLQNNCAKCGDALAPGAKFCRGCGTKKDEPKPQATGGDDAKKAELENAAVARVEAGGGFWDEDMIDFAIDYIDKGFAAVGEAPTGEWERERLIKEAVPWMNRKFPMEGGNSADTRFYFALAIGFGPRVLGGLVTWWRGTGAAPAGVPGKVEQPKTSEGGEA